MHTFKNPLSFLYYTCIREKQLLLRDEASFSPLKQKNMINKLDTEETEA